MSSSGAYYSFPSMSTINYKGHLGAIFHTTTFCISRHNPRQSKITEKGNPNSISHVTMKNKIVHRLSISLAHAASVQYNDTPLLEVTHGKDLS